jgi:hypothetical protein
MRELHGRYNTMPVKGLILRRCTIGCGVILALVSSGIVGCGPNLEQVRESHSKAIEAKMAQLPSIREQVRTLPRTDRDWIQMPAGAVVVNLGLSAVAGENATISYAEDLADPLELGFVWRRIPRIGLLNECGSVVRRGHEAFNPCLPMTTLPRPFAFSAESLFNRCEAFRYLFVVRTFEFVEPSQPTKTSASASTAPTTPSSPAFKRDGGLSDAAAPTDADAGASSASEDRYWFDGGYIRGDVLGFELASGRALGGFGFVASNSPRVEGLDVGTELLLRFRSVVLDGIRKNVTGATVSE